MKRSLSIIAILALILGVSGSAYAFSNEADRDSLERDASGLIDCTSCHSGMLVPAVNDPHNGDNGNDCNSCHLDLDGWVLRPTDEVEPTDGVDPTDGRAPVTPGCGQEVADGSLQVVCNNFPEDMVSAKVMIFPSQFFVPTSENSSESEKKMALAPVEGTARCKNDGAPATVMSKDDRKTAASLSGGRHRVLVIIKKGLLKSELALTNVVVNGDTTLNLDYEKLRFPIENLEDLFQKFKENAENRPENEAEDFQFPVN